MAFDKETSETSGISVFLFRVGTIGCTSYCFSDNVRSGSDLSCPCTVEAERLNVSFQRSFQSVKEIRQVDQGYSCSKGLLYDDRLSTERIIQELIESRYLSCFTFAQVEILKRSGNRNEK